jgi:sulfite exporter TauE/SafE
MCGPIALMIPVDRTNPTKKAIQIITYHLGRLFIGVAMIITMLTPESVLANYNFSKPVYRLISKIKSSLGKQFKNKSYKSLFTIGLLNGFLPCGMVYVALFGAIAMQNVPFGILYMLLFGIGTIPMMSSVTYLNSIMTVSFRNKIQKLIPYVGVVIGVLFILRGLGLGIPYVSPANMSLFVQETPNCH